MGQYSSFFSEYISGMHTTTRCSPAWVRLRGTNAHTVSLSARVGLAVCTNLHCLVNRDTRAFLVTCPQILVRKLVVSGLEPGLSSFEASLCPRDHSTRSDRLKKKRMKRMKKRVSFQLLVKSSR